MHSGTHREPDCCEIQCNLISQKEIAFLLCVYLPGRDIMREEAFWYQCLEEKGHRPAMIDQLFRRNSIYKRLRSFQKASHADFFPENEFQNVIHERRK